MPILASGFAPRAGMRVSGSVSTPRVTPLVRTDVTCKAQAVFEEGSSAPPRLAYLALWLSLAGYAFTVAPGGSTEAASIDADIIKTMISTPFDPANTISPVFTSLFNALGVLPAVYASLLLPGTKNGQKVPGLAFVISSFALGFGGLGPYLGLRNKREEVLDSERGRGSAVFEFKLTSVTLLLFSLYLAYFGVTGAYTGGDRVTDFIELFKSQRLVHVSTIDFTILSLAMADPLSEDMRRRDWRGAPAAAFCAVPVIGPCVYLCLRPSLPK